MELDNVQEKGYPTGTAAATAHNLSDADLISDLSGPQW